MREIPFGNDGSFSWEGMTDRYNSDLANDFGNLASRVLNMAERYLGGEVPRVPTGNELTSVEDELRATHERAKAGIATAMDGLELHEALKVAWSFVRRANAYVEEVQPWVLAKDEAEKRRLEVVLYHLLDSLRLMAIMTWPIMPGNAQTLWIRLGIESDVAEARLGRDDVWGSLIAGLRVTKGEALFPRIDDSR
jgi:methionyl-tRNA synthetase